MTSPEVSNETFAIQQIDPTQTLGKICAVSCVYSRCMEDPGTDGKTWCERNGMCAEEAEECADSPTILNSLPQLGALGLVDA